MKDYGLAIDAALTAYSDNSARSMQSDKGILGPSDIGFCRQLATLKTIGVEPTDSVPVMAAAIGTAIHTYTEAAIKAMFPTWLVGSLDKIRLTATLPSGVEISGHPDIIIPEDNTILDIKTKDGLQWVKRQGTDQSHKFQRHLYAMGAIAAGYLDGSKPIYVGNIYIDRSGKESVVYQTLEEMDPTLTDEIDAWIGDVIYAVKTGEAASRDLPSAVCQKICSHFTVCRGGLTMNEGGQPILDGYLLDAVDMYNESKEIIKMHEKSKAEAQNILVGINGTTGKHDVRWVEVQPSGNRSGYMRLDISKTRSQ